MHAHAIGGNIGRGRVQGFDIGLSRAQESLFRHILVAGVARHRQIGAVELQVETGGGNRFIFGPHRRDQIRQIGFVAGIESVGLKRRDQARRRGIHEAARALAVTVQRGPEAANVIMQRLQVLQFHWRDAGGAE